MLTVPLIDCFVFYNELDLLELRLDELSSVVDQFVLIESTVSYSGAPKPLYFAEQAQRFAAYRDKITAIALTEPPAPLKSIAVMDFYQHSLGYRSMVKKNYAYWQNEIYQRDEIGRHLSAFKDDSMMIISDVDELPRAKVLRDLSVTTVGDGLALEMNHYLHFVNTKAAKPWSRAKIVPINKLKTKTATEIRLNDALPVLPKAGWHFSSLGTVERILEKIKNYSHQDLVQHTDVALLELYLKLNLSHIESGPALTTVPLTNDFPAKILAHPEKYQSYLRPMGAPPALTAAETTLLCREIIRLREALNQVTMERDELKEAAASIDTEREESTIQ